MCKIESSVNLSALQLLSQQNCKSLKFLGVKAGEPGEKISEGVTGELQFDLTWFAWSPGWITLHPWSCLQALMVYVSCQNWSEVEGTSSQMDV